MQQVLLLPGMAVMAKYIQLAMGIGRLHIFELHPFDKWLSDYKHPYPSRSRSRIRDSILYLSFTGLDRRELPTPSFKTTNTLPIVIDLCQKFPVERLAAINFGITKVVVTLCHHFLYLIWLVFLVRLFPSVWRRLSYIAGIP